MNQPPALQFDYDTMTLGQALPWFKGVAMILFGCLFAGLAGLFTGGMLGNQDAGFSGNDLVSA